jgi:hypothetical protein
MLLKIFYEQRICVNLNNFEFMKDISNLLEINLLQKVFCKYEILWRDEIIL